MKSLPVSKAKALLIIAAFVSESLAADEGLKPYVVEYPTAERFCPPIAGFFEEVVRTTERVGYRTFRHQPNGGYGLAVADKVGDANLLHLGADVGFYRAGEPVFAVADGVVRVSEGPPPVAKNRKARGQKLDRWMDWGNLVVLEHQLSDESFVTTIYGHLADQRLVEEGELIRAGEQIGTIGKGRENGGYKPHLHFGVREGRMVETGRLLMVVPFQGNQLPLRIAELKDEVVVLSGAENLPDVLQLNIADQKFEIRRQGGNVVVTSAILHVLESPEFAIVGYGLTTDGWRDPVAFLKEYRADVTPAPFEAVKRPRNHERPRRNANRGGEVRAKP